MANAVHGGGKGVVILDDTMEEDEAGPAITPGDSSSPRSGEKRRRRAVDSSASSGVSTGIMKKKKPEKKKVRWIIPNPQNPEISWLNNFKGNVPKFFDEIRKEFNLKKDFVVTSDETQTRQAFKIRSSKVKSGENLEIYAEQLFRKNSPGAGDDATLSISVEDTAFVVCADVEQTVCKLEWSGEDVLSKVLAVGDTKQITVRGNWNIHCVSTVTIDFAVSQDGDGSDGVTIDPKKLVLKSSEAAPGSWITANVHVTVNTNIECGSYVITPLCQLSGGATLQPPTGLPHLSVDHRIVAPKNAGGHALTEAHLTIFGAPVVCMKDQAGSRGLRGLPAELASSTRAKLGSNLVVDMAHADTTNLDSDSRKRLIGFVHAFSWGFTGSDHRPHLKLAVPLNPGHLVQTRFELAHQYSKIGVASVDNAVFLVVAANPKLSDRRELSCYVILQTEWRFIRDVLIDSGGGVVVFDLDNTLVCGEQIRHGWQHLTECAFRDADSKDKHAFFRVYISTRNEGPKEHIAHLWELLAARANKCYETDGIEFKELPPLNELCGTDYVRDTKVQKGLRQCLGERYEVEQHCAVAFDDKGYDAQTKKSKGGKGKEKKRGDNWDAESDNHVFTVVPFTVYPSKTAKREDQELVVFGGQLNEARKTFVKNLRKVGECILSSAELPSKGVALSSLAQCLRRLVDEKSTDDRHRNYRARSRSPEPVTRTRPSSRDAGPAWS
eukprot:m.66097 g.66097  ORF g.66097 m.66097 type:complete len:722 (+) comp18047_c0_seq6:384-2549(+)